MPSIAERIKDWANGNQSAQPPAAPSGGPSPGAPALVLPPPIKAPPAVVRPYHHELAVQAKLGAEFTTGGIDIGGKLFTFVITDPNDPTKTNTFTLLEVSADALKGTGFKARGEMGLLLAATGAENVQKRFMANGVLMTSPDTPRGQYGIVNPRVIVGNLSVGVQLELTTQGLGARVNLLTSSNGSGLLQAHADFFRDTRFALEVGARAGFLSASAEEVGEQFAVLTNETAIARIVMD
ncbi:MAG: hypothetical protein WC841_03525 [Candidatus Shapirobacteria bacterium]